MGGTRKFQIGPVQVRLGSGDDISEAAPKERLTRDRIVDVALEQMRERGYGAVSMRSIARELGTGPASLYAHVANKDALDQLVIDRIASRIVLSAPDPGRWQEQVREHLRGALAAYRAHPGAAQAGLATIPTGEGGMRIADGLLGVVLAGGIHPQAAAWFLDLVALYVSAIAAEESIWAERGKSRVAGGDPFTEEDVIAGVHQLFRAAAPTAYPFLSAHADAMVAGDADTRFEFGLDVLLAGLEVVSRRMTG